MAVIGAFIERFLLRRLAGQELAQVLLTLGFSFIVADICLMVWTGDPWQPPTPRHLQGAVQVAGLFFPLYRLTIVGVAVVIAIALWVMVDWTRLGAMIRAGVDDAPIARVVGIKVSQLFTLIFALGAGLAAFAGVIGAPYLSVYPGLDAEMLPLALIVVILGGSGSLLGALGHAGLFAMAGYAGALVLQAGHGHFVADLAAVAVTVAASAVFGVLALRSTGIGFLMITLALGQIVWGIAYRWAGLTNGDNGVNVSTRPAPFGLSLASAPSFYFATLVVFLLAIASMAVFVRSPFGTSLRG